MSFQSVERRRDGAMRPKWAHVCIHRVEWTEPATGRQPSRRSLRQLPEKMCTRDRGFASGIGMSYAIGFMNQNEIDFRMIVGLESADFSGNEQRKAALALSSGILRYGHAVLL